MSKANQEKRKNSYAGRKRKSRYENGSQLTNKRAKRKETKSDLKYKNKSFTEEAKEMLKLYIKLKSIYEEEGMTQKTHQFLTRITKKKVIKNFKNFHFHKTVYCLWTFNIASSFFEKNRILESFLSFTQ